MRKRKPDSSPSPSKRQRKTDSDQQNKGTEETRGEQDPKDNIDDKPKRKAAEAAQKRKDEIKKAQEQEDNFVFEAIIASREVQSFP